MGMRVDRGKMVEVVLRAQYGCRCARCAFVEIREFDGKSREAFQDVLKAKGWERKHGEGYVCAECLAGQPRFKREEELSPSHKIVLRGMRADKWEPQSLMRLAKVSRQRVYQIRDELKEFGFVKESA